MSTYKKMYLTLVRAQRDAILILQEAHQKTEEMFLAIDVPDHLHVIRSQSLQKREQADIRCLNLSARLYNALERRFGERGRDYTPTIKDVLSIESFEELRNIRNLGKKSYLELIIKMREAGFTNWSEQMSNQLDRCAKYKKDANHPKPQQFECLWH